MRITIALLAVLLFSSAAQAQEQRKDTWMRAGYVALGAVSFADIESTGRCLERSGCSERNPIFKPFTGTPGAVGLVNGAISTGVGLSAYTLHKRGKRKEARVVIWTWTIVRAAVVVHNVRQLRER